MLPIWGIGNTSGETCDSIPDQILYTMLLDMLPSDLPFVYISGLRKMESYEDLRERLEGEVEYHRAGANKLELHKQMLVAEAAEREHPCKQDQPTI